MHNEHDSENRTGYIGQTICMDGMDSSAFFSKIGDDMVEYCEWEWDHWRRDNGYPSYIHFTGADRYSEGMIIEYGPIDDHDSSYYDDYFGDYFEFSTTTDNYDYFDFLPTNDGVSTTTNYRSSTTSNFNYFTSGTTGSGSTGSGTTGSYYHYNGHFGSSTTGSFGTTASGTTSFGTSSSATTSFGTTSSGTISPGTTSPGTTTAGTTSSATTSPGTTSQGTTSPGTTTPGTTSPGTTSQGTTSPGSTSQGTTSSATTSPPGTTAGSATTSFGTTTSSGTTSFGTTSSTMRGSGTTSFGTSSFTTPGATTSTTTTNNNRRMLLQTPTSAPTINPSLNPTTEPPTLSPTRSPLHTLNPTYDDRDNAGAWAWQIYYFRYQADDYDDYGWRGVVALCPNETDILNCGGKWIVAEGYDDTNSALWQGIVDANLSTMSCDNSCYGDSGAVCSICFTLCSALSLCLQKQKKHLQHRLQPMTMTNVSQILIVGMMKNVVIMVVVCPIPYAKFVNKVCFLFILALRNKIFVHDKSEMTLK